MVFVLTYVMTLHYAQNCERMRLGARATGGGVVLYTCTVPAGSILGLLTTILEVG